MQSQRKRTLKTEVLITVELEPGTPSVEIPAALSMPGPPDVILKTPVGDFEWFPDRDQRIRSWRYFRQSEGMTPVAFDYFDHGDIGGKSLDEFNLSSIREYVQQFNLADHSGQPGISGFITRFLRKFTGRKPA